MDLDEDHFVGAVLFLLYSPEHIGAPRQIQRVVHLAQETPPHYMMVDPVDLVGLSSSSSSSGLPLGSLSPVREPSLPYPFYMLSTPPDSDDIQMTEPEDSNTGVLDPTVAGMASPEVIMIDSSSEDSDPSMDEDYVSQDTLSGQGDGMEGNGEDEPMDDLSDASSSIGSH